MGFLLDLESVSYKTKNNKLSDNSINITVNKTINF